MNALELLVNTIGGGATGYITNDLAVKMLFRQYGPLGGVILKTKADFISNISALVERDIINHHTLEQQLDKPEFKAVVEQISAHILHTSLEAKTQGLTLGQVPQVDQAWKGLLGFYAENFEGVAGELWQALDNQIIVNDLLSDEQIDYLAGRLIDIALLTLQESQSIETLITDLYLEAKGKKLTDFVPAELAEKVAQNWRAANDNFHQRLFEGFDQQIEATINSIWGLIGLDQSLMDLVGRLQQKKLGELLGEKNSTKLISDLRAQLIALAKTDQGKGLLATLVSTVVEALKAIDKPVLAMFKDDLRGNLEEFLSQRLPKVVFSLVTWIKEHQQELEAFISEAIEETVNETLEEESEGLLNIQGKIKKYLFQFLAQGNALERFQIINKIVEGIEKNSDVHQLSQDVAEDIMKFLNTKTFGELVQNIEENGLVTPEKLSGLILKNLAGWFDKLDWVGFQDYLDYDLASLAEVLGIDLATSVMVAAKHIRERLREELLYTNRLTSKVQAALVELIITTAKTDLAQLISEEQLSQVVTTGKQHMVAMLFAKKAFLTEELASLIRATTRGKRFSELLPSQVIAQAVGYTGKNSTEYLHRQWPVVQQQEVEQLIHLIRDWDDSSEQLTQLMLVLAKQNLPLMTEGKIQSLVATNLTKLPDRQLQAMVEDFMGTELKPISALGGLFGVIFAVAFHGLQSEFGITGSTSLILNTGIYSFVGYITNVLALKMVFWPYTQKTFLGMKVPFTPGIVAKSKPRFARSMGKFVGKELLNPNGINDTFQQKRPRLKNRFIKAVAKDNYRRIEESLLTNRLILSEQIYVFLQNWWGDHQQPISTELAQKILQLPVHQVDVENLLLKLRAEGQVKRRLVSYLGTKYQREFKSEQTLLELLPSFAKSGLNQRVKDGVQSKIAEGINLLSDEEQVRLRVNALNPSFDQVKVKKLKELLTVHNQELVNNWLSGQLQTLITKPEVLEQSVNYVKQKFLEPAGVSPSVGRWLHNLLKKILLQHSELILDNMLKRMMNLLRQEKRQLKRVALEAAQEIDGYALANWFLDLDDTIDNVVERLVEIKIPEFMHKKSGELEAMLVQVLSKLMEDGVLDFDVQLAENGIREVMRDITESQVVGNGINDSSRHIVDTLFDVKLGNLLSLAGINSLDDLFTIFAEELSILRTELLSQLNANQPQLEKIGINLTQQIIDQLILQLPIQKLTSQIDNIDDEVRNLFEQLKQSPAVQTNFQQLIRMLQNQLADNGLGGLVDANRLQADLNNTLTRILAREELSQKVKVLLQTNLEKLILNFNHLLPPASKDFLLDIIIESMLDSVQQYFLELMNTINIQAVTEAEINNMDPQQIEDLFNSFAQRYFRQLEHSGAWLGGIVGILTETLTHIA